MALLSVAQARARILANARTLNTETVALFDADGRTLARDLQALRTQPPFDVSAMDGFAVRRDDVATLPVRLTLIGEAAAGRGFDGCVGEGQAVRIFTGAPVPGGANAIVIQENTRYDLNQVDIIAGAPETGHIRKRGIDFAHGDRLIAAGTVLNARDVTLAAAMGHASLGVRRRPKVALIATGDELVLPGAPVGADQIVCSNPFGIAAMVRRAGGEPMFLGIAPDDRDALGALCRQAADADILVTIGGASVGDHDIVAPVLQALGMALDFWRIAMRPGKPLMFGRLAHSYVIGLPGNPVSSLICTRVFVVPLIRALLGQTAIDTRMERAVAGAAMAANGPRQHYMRAVSRPGDDGVLHVTPIASQDSSLLASLAKSDVLIVRPPNDRPVSVGQPVSVLRLDF